mgnify:FL=1
MGNYNNNRNNRRDDKQGFGNGLSVEVRNGNVEQAIRKLKKLVMKTGLMN